LTLKTAIAADVEDIDAAFVVKDSTGQKLAYVYYEDEPGRRSAAKLLSKLIGAATNGPGKFLLPPWRSGVALHRIGHKPVNSSPHECRE
jgi:hypothetical protein